MNNSLEELTFDNRFIQELPADPKSDNYTRQVMQSCYSYVEPTKVSKPQLVAYSKEVAELLDLSSEVCESADFTNVFSGNQLLAGMKPYAACYGGHQFGNWAGQLGDGRAINLGEVINRKGERWALQLKGAGPTPYSRMADGLAVLRSSVREFLCSEAMYHLGVPTTRALSLILSGEQVMRDMFYDGHPKMEPGAIVCRVAPSFTRFGNFQIFSARKETELLKQLVDFTIRTDFPHLGEPSPEVYQKWFEEICRTTAEMIVHWMRVGFVHGVMNTDNMSILGLTIDYGPYGWVENYDPHWTPNTTDAMGRRYRFITQAQVGHWNLAQLANALVSLLKPEILQEALDQYPIIYEAGWKNMMAQKLGLKNFEPQLNEELHQILQLTETDMTIFYRQLAKLDIEQVEHQSDLERIESLKDAYYAPDDISEAHRQKISQWIKDYALAVKKENVEPETRIKQMNSVNPKYVLRNYLAQLAIDKSEAGDHSMVNELLELFRHPYDEQPDKEEYNKKRPEWARHRAGCSMLSCSS